MTAEQIALLNGRVGDVTRNLQLFQQQFTEEMKQRRNLEQESRLLQTNLEAGLVQTEANILKRMLTVVDAKSRELTRRCEDVERVSEERYGAQRSAMEGQWRAIVNKEAEEKVSVCVRAMAKTCLLPSWALDWF